MPKNNELHSREMDNLVEIARVSIPTMPVTAARAVSSAAIGQWPLRERNCIFKPFKAQLANHGGRGRSDRDN